MGMLYCETSTGIRKLAPKRHGPCGLVINKMLLVIRLPITRGEIRKFMSLKKVGLVGLLAAAALAIPASAATIEELQAQVNALLAQLSALQGGGGSSAGCYNFTVDLTIGSTGADVTALQSFLESKGHFTFTGAKGYFGSITQSALAAWQAANGVAPAAGYFGPISRAKYNMLCTPTTPPTTGGGSGSGSSFFVGNDEGSLDVTGQISKYANEKVGEDQDDVTVLGVEVEADGADQMIERVTVVIDQPSDSSEDDLEDFIQDVSVWLDGEELGRMDVDEASYSRSADKYTFRFVGLEGIIEEGDEVELLIAVTGPRSVNGDTKGEGWAIAIPDSGIRAASPNGVTESYDGDADTRFSVETFASANSVELKAKRSSDSPAEQTVVGDSDDEFDAELLGFELTAKGSDIEVFSLEFGLTTSGPSVVQIASRLMLECDGEEWSETAATTTVFEDLEFVVDKGDTVNCMLSAEMNEIDGTVFKEGDWLRAVLNMSQTDAEDESGSGGSKLAGSANGYAQTFISEGLEISGLKASNSVQTQATVSGQSSIGKYVIEFSATANDTEVYLVRATEDVDGFDGGAGDGAGDDDEGIVYTVDTSGTPDAVTAILECIGNCGSSVDNPAGFFYIAEGDTEKYRLTVTVTAEAGGTNLSYGVWVDSINWGTDGLTGNRFYTSSLGDDSDADAGNLFLNSIL